MALGLSRLSSNNCYENGGQPPILADMPNPMPDTVQSRTAVERFDSRLASPVVWAGSGKSNGHVVVHQIGLTQRIKSEDQFYNVMTLCVVEPGPVTGVNFEFVTPKPVPVRGHKGCSVGLVRYRRSLAHFREIITEMEEHSRLDFGKGPMDVSGIMFDRAQFCRANATKTFANNRILSRNFYGGSHTQVYATSSPLLGLPDLLPGGLPSAGLTEALDQLPGFPVADVPEHIGNVLIQFTAPPLAVDIERSGGKDTLTVRGAWRSGFEPLSLRLIPVFEDTVGVPVVASGKAWSHNLEAFSEFNEFRLDVQELRSGEIVYSIARTNFLRQISLRTGFMSAGPGEPLHIDGGTERIRRLSSETPMTVGPDETSQRTRERKAQNAAELANLERRLAFFRYGGTGRPLNHEKAISDLNRIIERYGQSGAWLWDPYLSGNCVLKTLCRSVYSGSDLRALSGGESVSSRSEVANCPKKETLRSARGHKLFKTIWRSVTFSPSTKALGDSKGILGDSDAKDKTKQEVWRSEQIEALKSGLKDMTGVRLRFLERVGDRGFPFHDRFLILPQQDGTHRVWSLGTSVNQLGKKHHIIQEVHHSRQIAAAFLAFWNALDGHDAYHVWPTL